jgi:hypothetical protein
MSSPRAVVVARRPLRYRRGADPSMDRPAWVRAASGLAWWGHNLVVVQDDAAFLGFVDPDTGLVADLPLREGHGGRRVFDAGLGNKQHKPDFEIVFVVDGHLVALGSGGPLAARRTALWWTPGASGPVEVGTRALAEALTTRHLPAGSALNLEGGEVWDGRVVLGQRGGDRGAPDQLLFMDQAGFSRWLAAPDDVPPTEEVTLELGAVDGLALHLTDLTTDRHFSAAAEDTTSFYDDGEVVGSVIGRLGPTAPEWVARVVEADGTPTRDKVEGLVPAGDGWFWAVTDPDDPDRPGELLHLRVG